jgi:putative FmdB family regulatory protein
MPIYDYNCRECGHTDEKFVRRVEDAPAVVECPSCHSETFERVVANRCGMLLTGTGYYQSDFKNPQQPPQVKETVH